MEYLSNGQLMALLGKSCKSIFRRRPSVRIVAQPPPGPPLVSVIIATYNWSSVLRFAIRSVLWQTEQNFEVLVMGDGCTDDSEAVAKSFGDARIHWHNLPQNSGHQSAPNNAGIDLARGRYITYLGHDDVWHPEHLRATLSAITLAQADFATPLTEMIGPEGSNFRDITGIYPPDGYDGTKGFPLSGIMHRREAIARIGNFKDYRAICQNPDLDIVFRAFEAGLKFVSTNELTVFKFNSALRKNCYREKPCHEQRRYTQRIEKHRWFYLREWLDIARVHYFRLPVRILEIPKPPTPETLGWYVSQYRKIRGLE